MKSAFEIPFVGLKIGVHEFEFDIDNTFFESLPYSLIEKGSLKAWLSLEKKETMLIASFDIDGTVETECSRCNEPMDVEVFGEMEIIYKFGHEAVEDENLIVISPDSYEIDITQPIYELITVSLPSRPVHDEGECDEEMVKLIEKFQSTENNKNDDDTDPRWSALKNLN
jgi:uncharacterized metal-binding protein YceD (DUF177 family)